MGQGKKFKVKWKAEIYFNRFDGDWCIFFSDCNLFTFNRAWHLEIGDKCYTKFVGIKRKEFQGSMVQKAKLENKTQTSH